LYNKDRSKEIRKLESEGGGFKPAEFKSSRSSRFKQGEDKSAQSNKDSVHESSIFGPIERPFTTTNKTDIQTAVNILTSDMNQVANSTSKFVNNTVLHDRVK
jgi:hypothetical protein